jgi:hypothetical protein
VASLYQSSARRSPTSSAIPNAELGRQTMAPAKQAPTKRKHGTKAGLSHETILSEEEISDVSLATFYLFDNEGAAAIRRGARLALRGRGCPCVGFGCGPTS